MPLTTALENGKYMTIHSIHLNLMKYLKDLCTDLQNMAEGNYKCLLREICSVHSSEVSVLLTFNYPQIDLWSLHNPIKIPAHIFIEMDKLILKFI